jgi:hypothetical protein
MQERKRKIWAVMKTVTLASNKNKTVEQEQRKKNVGCNPYLSISPLCMYFILRARRFLYDLIVDIYIGKSKEKRALHNLQDTKSFLI